MCGAFTLILSGIKIAAGSYIPMSPPMIVPCIETEARCNLIAAGEVVVAADMRYPGHKVDWNVARTFHRCVQVSGKGS